MRLLLELPAPRTSLFTRSLAVAVSHAGRATGLRSPRGGARPRASADARTEQKGSASRFRIRVRARSCAGGRGARDSPRSRGRSGRCESLLPATIAERQSGGITAPFLWRPVGSYRRRRSGGRREYPWRLFGSGRPGERRPDSLLFAYVISTKQQVCDSREDDGNARDRRNSRRRDRAPAAWRQHATTRGYSNAATVAVPAHGCDHAWCRLGDADGDGDTDPCLDRARHRRLQRLHPSRVRPGVVDGAVSDVVNGEDPRQDPHPPVPRICFDIAATLSQYRPRPTMNAVSTTVDAVSETFQ